MLLFIVVSTENIGTVAFGKFFSLSSATFRSDLEDTVARLPKSYDYRDNLGKRREEEIMLVMVGDDGNGIGGGENSHDGLGEDGSVGV
ncbi:Hypothetical predicted protein [Octopus vulgaris]|uniref:Uncharacterized protein n=1 Tax=Octopus vulgaris TaxID=6645 RepID=A0AA36B5Y3_OCTVU|nr:Hypothetical predicted protein [Octopus vulgaris]